MDKPLVSVIMATYNCGQYIAEAINSVVNQTYPNIELIIVNDGSTDNTIETIAKISQQTDKIQIKVICQENKGVAAAKNRGIEAVKGEYVAFLDADDMLEPRYIETAIVSMQVGDLDAVSFNFHRTDENRNQLEIGSTIDTLRFIKFKELIKNPLPLGFLVVKRHFLTNKAHDERLTFAEDYDMWLRLLRGGANWSFYRKPLAHYMMRHNSICHTYENDIAGKLWIIYSKHIDKIGFIRAWLYYRKRLAIYRFVYLKKALKSKQLKRIIKHALIAAKSPLLIFSLRDFWLRIFSFSS